MQAGIAGMNVTITKDHVSIAGLEFAADTNGAIKVMGVTVPLELKDRGTCVLQIQV